MNLFEEIDKGNEKGVISFLKKNTSKLETKTENGFTLLHYAVIHKQESLVDFLIEKRSKLIHEETTVQSITPLHYAVFSDTKKNLSITRKLLAAGASIDAKTSLGNTALHIAAKSGNYLQVRILIQGGALKDAQNKKKYTASKLANRYGYERIASFLSKTYDEANASDTDSEDEQDYHFRGFRKRKPKIVIVNDGEQKKRKDKKTEIKQESEKTLVAHFRGLHFYLNYFERKGRRNARRFHEFQNEGILPRQGTYSSAVHELSGFNCKFPKISKKESSIEKVRIKIKKKEEQFAIALKKIIENMEVLQDSGKRKRCLGLSQGSRDYYKNRFIEFIQFYVNSYNKLSEKLKKAGEKNEEDGRSSKRTKEENKVLKQIGSTTLPIVSTSEEPRWGLEYAYALVNWDKKETHNIKSGIVLPLHPSYQSDGHPRFPYLGIVYLYLHDPNELSGEASARILDLFTQNLIDTKPLYIHARERAFIGGISPKNVYFSLPVRVPNFYHPYRPDYLKKYGLDEGKYNHFKASIAQYGKIIAEDEMLDEKRFNQTQQKIIEHVINFLNKTLHKIASDIASEKNATLKYLSTNSEELLDDPSPIKEFIKLRTSITGKLKI